MREMRKRFNVTGACFPKDHYMVNLDKRLSEIKEMVDRGDYFVINRGRQYGKSTILFALAEYLRKDYVVAHLDFQLIDPDLFKTAKLFSGKFAKDFSKNLLKGDDAQFLDKNALESLSENNPPTDLSELFERLSNLCSTSQRPIVLIIDEVDQASNNQVFLSFLAQLRGYYLDRRVTPTFQSVILAGVYNIKSLRDKYAHEGGHQLNSPWNIAAKFNVDMDFSTEDIESMLQEYEADTHTGMDIPKIAQLIYDYTSGYPVLVSSICQELDEEIAGTKPFPTLSAAWTEAGVMEAVRIIVKGQNDNQASAMIFDSLTTHIERYPELGGMLRKILFDGDKITYIKTNKAMTLGLMFGYMSKKGEFLQVANRMFEMWLYDLFLAEDSLNTSFPKIDTDGEPPFIKDNKLNMDLVMEKFVEYFTAPREQVADDEAFLEKQGRRMFLLFLKPIINGVGSYYIEAKTRTSRRTDLLVKYLGDIFILELKIWRGDDYNESGKKQLTAYLNDWNLDKGYLLTFSFIKGKQVGVKKTIVDGKTIVEATV